jgi:hypothetical protein
MDEYTHYNLESIVFKVFGIAGSTVFYLFIFIKEFIFELKTS